MKISSGNRLTSLFGIRIPIIQAGMIWASGWELASAVSNAGGLGLLGSGSMYPDELRQQIFLVEWHLNLTMCLFFRNRTS